MAPHGQDRFAFDLRFKVAAHAFPLASRHFAGTAVGGEEGKGSGRWYGRYGGTLLLLVRTTYVQEEEPKLLW